MGPEEIAKLIEHNPVLLTILGVCLIAGYVLKIMSQASETAAKLLGPLGKRWREQGDKAARRAESKRAEENAVVLDLRNQLQHFKNRLEEVERTSGPKDDYLVYDAEWHARNEIHAAETGYESPVPKHMTFNEFRRKASGWSD